ncbi:MAG: hypothetical protein ACOY3P_20780 [Planctomycetota bacterium]
MAVRGEGITDGETRAEVVMLDDVIPAVRATSDRGAVRVVSTALRAPVFPAGIDVLSVRVQETGGRARTVTLGLQLPKSARAGIRSATLGRGASIAYPPLEVLGAEMRPWGYTDDGRSMPGWGKPERPCDPAFRSIRAGMGGVPLVYRFQVPAGSVHQVALGFCESHWAESGQRVMHCEVEGAESQTVDPVARWGRHAPGVLLFTAQDANGDGWLEVAVRPAPNTRDGNPILNALWLLPETVAVDADQMIAGALNAAATRYVDVGGAADQSLLPGLKVEYTIELPASGAKELVFLIAHGKTPLPDPNSSAWTPDLLRKAAADVWRDWHE